jgi:hypothetical protein
MDTFAPRPGGFGSLALPDAQTELRWQDSELWPVRRPYPIDIPCPVCGAFARCDFFGQQKCPRGHLFGQRAFWNGQAASCALLLEDTRNGRLTIFPNAALHWHDDGRLVVGAPAQASWATGA